MNSNNKSFLKDMKLYQKNQVLGTKILTNCQSRLYYLLPFGAAAFAGLQFCTEEVQKKNKTETIETNGESIFFNTSFLVRLFRKDPMILTRGYLHMLLHCMFLHIYPDEIVCHSEKRKQIWNLACDICVEAMIEDASIPGISNLFSDLSKSVDLYICSSPNMEYLDSAELLRTWERTISIAKKKSFSARAIYNQLLEDDFLDSFLELTKLFSFDNHTIWYNSAKETAACGRKKWKSVRSYVKSARSTGGQPQNTYHASGKSGSLEEENWNQLPVRMDYRRYLKQFTYTREEVILDPESFDYIYYNYGMEHYDGIPFIEPLEYKDTRKLEELVVAIDTSGSCSKEIVEQFLSETYEILTNREFFFSKMNVHLLFCDCVIQAVYVIHSKEEWIRFCKNLVIQGRGDTDFRPVFQYIDQLRLENELTKLRSVIYFTDGDGIYPREAPDYETAFVMLREKANLHLVPSWAKAMLI